MTTALISEGINVVGVQFRPAGKIYDFMSGELDLRVGDDVVVDSDRGPSLAKVVQVKYLGTGDIEDRKLKPIMRRAGHKDVGGKKARLTPEEVSAFTSEKVRTLDLNMRVLQSEVQFGGNKVIIYFSAPGRVDFRELVKDLAGGLKARVELKQVGARDETKLLGGVGICGREYCCSSFLRDFVPVSIKMAKNQNLALNPSKVSGGCGRLLCCLTYENDTYTKLRSILPPRGTRVRIKDRDERGVVLKADLLNQVVLIETEIGQQVTMAVEAVEILDYDAAARPSGAMEEAEIWGEDIDLDLLSQHMHPMATTTGNAKDPELQETHGEAETKDSSTAGEARGPRGRRRGRRSRPTRPLG